MENWIFESALIFITLYLLGLYLWNKKVSWRLNDKITSWTKRLHYTFVILLVTAGVLNFISAIRFRGIWTTHLMIIGILFSGLLISLLSDWKDRSRFEKYYFKLYGLLPVVTVAILMIPIVGLIIVAVVFGRLTQPVEKIYFEDTTLRVQSTFVGLGVSQLDVLEKRGPFEIKLNKELTYAERLDSVKIEQRSDRTILLLYSNGSAKDTVQLKKINQP